MSNEGDFLEPLAAQTVTAPDLEHMMTAEMERLQADSAQLQWLKTRLREIGQGAPRAMGSEGPVHLILVVPVEDWEEWTRC